MIHNVCKSDFVLLRIKCDVLHFGHCKKKRKKERKTLLAKSLVPCSCPVVQRARETDIDKIISQCKENGKFNTIKCL